MDSHRIQPDEDTFGISLTMEPRDGHCSIAVDALVGFLKHVTHTQRALRKMGVDLSRAQSIQRNVQIFTLAPAGDVKKTSAVGHPAIIDELNRATLPLVSTVHACLKAAGAVAAEVPSPLQHTEPESFSDAGAPATIEGLNMELIRRRVAGGPNYVLLNGKPTPWSANLTTSARGNPRPKPQPVVIEPVGNEVHLITSGNRRYHPEDEAEVSAVEPGSRIVVEACSTERILFAESDALILQRELEFPEDQPEP